MTNSQKFSQVFKKKFFSVYIIVFDTGLKKAVLGQYNLDRYDFYLISKGYISKPPFQSEAKCEAINIIFFYSHANETRL